MFTAEQVRKIIAVYGEWPTTPEGYEDPTEYRAPINECVFFNKSTVIDGYTSSVPHLICKPKPRRYRFICDDPTPRNIKEGEWTTYLAGRKHPESFIRADASFFEEIDYPVIIFRREEIID